MARARYSSEERFAPKPVVRGEPVCPVSVKTNAAGSTAPLNVICRCILGVTPLEPGFAKISVRPRLGSLRMIKAKIPTLAGTVTLHIENKGSAHDVELDTPAPALFEAFGLMRDLPAGHCKFSVVQ